MRFVCDKAPGGQAVITQAFNPVTGTEVTFSPPVVSSDPGQLDTLLANFELLCRVDHHFGQPPVTQVDPTAWPNTREQMAAFRSSLDCLA